MNCFKCREALYESGHFTMKLSTTESKAYDTIACFNSECSYFAQEIIQFNQNYFVRVNREIENMLVTEVLDKMGIRLDKSIDLRSLLREFLLKFPDQVAVHKSGKKDIMGFFIGRLMKENRSLDPKDVRTVLTAILNEK